MTQLSLQYIRSKLLSPFISEPKEIAAIEQIFHIFNFERERIAEYTQTPEFVSAYTLYYLSTNIAKWQACLDRLPLNIKERVNSSEVVEVGTGPGTFALAASLSGEFKGRWHGVDQSSLMLDQANKLFEQRDDASQFRFLSQIPNIKDATLIFTHSLNEMSLDQAERIIEKLNPKMIIWIEPGTKDFFQKAHQLRSYILKNDFDVLAPCLGVKACPAAQIQGEWCHQVLEVTHPACIERLCQKLSRDRRTMPVSFHVYSRAGLIEKESSPDEAIIFRVKKTHKHAQDLQICSNEQKLEDLEVSFRGLDKAQKKQLQKKLAGQRLDFQIIKELDTKKRVQLKI